MNIEEFKLYLPKYLSSASENELFANLKDFPQNIDQRLYTSHLQDDEFIYQGDGLKDMLIINLPDTKISTAPSMILSNTCDIDLQNIRNFTSQIVYAPIFRLEKYKASLIKFTSKSEEQIETHVEAITRQYITQIFYLPKIEGKLEDSIVFLDRINNTSNSQVDRKKLKKIRLFTLSDYGFYLFLFKLSMHFTRIQEKVERKSQH